VLTIGYWNLSPKFLWVFAYTKNFVQTIMKCYFLYSKRGWYLLALDDCIIKKIISFYAQVIVDVDLFSSLLQQLLVKHLGFLPL